MRQADGPARCERFVYDAYLFVCVESLRSPFFTLDKRMGDVAGEMGIRVLEVGR